MRNFWGFDFFALQGRYHNYFSAYHADVNCRQRDGLLKFAHNHSIEDWIALELKPFGMSAKKSAQQQGGVLFAKIIPFGLLLVFLLRLFQSPLVL